MLEPLLLSIRPATTADAEGLWALDQAIHLAGVGVVSTVDDLAPIEVIRAQLPGSPLQGRFVATHGDQVVGEALVERIRPALLRHVAVLSVGVHPAHQRRGLGRALVAACIAWCDAREVHRLELYVRADNDRAIGLYLSLGFAVEGTRHEFVRLPDGRLVDDHVMVRFRRPPAPP